MNRFPTEWKESQLYPGYKQRLNAEGHLETQPIAPSDKLGAMVMNDKDLLDLQLKEITKLKVENTYLREAAVRLTHKFSGKCWKECDQLVEDEINEAKLT